MKAYVLSVAGVVLLSAVVSVIVPNGKTGRFIKGAAKLAILAVLVSPFVSWLSEGEFSFDVTLSAFSEDEDYLKACAEALAREDEAAIGTYLAEQYGVTGEAEVTREAAAGFALQKICVKIVDFGIIAEDEHIDIMKEIQSDLAGTYGCETEVS